MIYHVIAACGLGVISLTLTLGIMILLVEAKE